MKNLILKDLIKAFFVLITIYYILNNYFVHPQIIDIKNYWSIEKRQHTLLAGISGHNYIVLKNQNENIVSEIHGLATNPITNTWNTV